MSMIEGIGDEVVVAFTGFAVVSAAVVLVWRSTRVQRVLPPAPPPQPSAPLAQPESEQSELDDSIAQLPEDPPTTGQSLSIKLKFLNDTERVVQVTEDWTIGQLKRIHLAQELDGGRKMVRMVFRGRELADPEQKISSAGLQDQATIHCLVSDRPQSQTNRNQQQQQQQQQAQHHAHMHRLNSGLDHLTEYDEVGRLLMPLLAIVLGCVWYARIKYRSLFDGFSSLALTAFTFAYLAAVAAHFYRLLGFGQQITAQNTSAQNSAPNSPRTAPRNASGDSNDHPSPISGAENNMGSRNNYPSHPPPPYSARDSPNHPHAD